MTYPCLYDGCERAALTGPYDLPGPYCQECQEKAGDFQWCPVQGCDQWAFNLPHTPNCCPEHEDIDGARYVPHVALALDATPMPASKPAGLMTDPAVVAFLERTLGRGCGDCYVCLHQPRLGFMNPTNRRMVVCRKCGNKRCPRATDHRLDCTGKNDSGQRGSRY